MAHLNWEDGVVTKLVVERGHTLAPAKGGISSTVLRDIRFREAKQAVAVPVGGLVEALDHEKRLANEAKAVFGHSGISDEYLRLLLTLDASAETRGQRARNQYVADLLGMNVSTVRGHRWQAKRRLG